MTDTSNSCEIYRASVNPDDQGECVNCGKSAGSHTTSTPEGVTPERIWAHPLRDSYDFRNAWIVMVPEPGAVPFVRGDIYEALAADRDAQEKRADAMRRSYDELYADALADAQSDAQEFEGELWKRLRDYLTELNLDWSYYTEDGITAEQAIEHIRECMDAETSRAEAAEAALAAEKAKTARLVEALEKIAANDRRTNCRNGNIHDHFHVDGPFGKIALAAIAEVQE